MNKNEKKSKYSKTVILPGKLMTSASSEHGKTGQQMVENAKYIS
jgi:hypothetical protein